MNTLSTMRGTILSTVLLVKSLYVSNLMPRFCPTGLEMLTTRLAPFHRSVGAAFSFLSTHPCQSRVGSATRLPAYNCSCGFERTAKLYFPASMSSFAPSTTPPELNHYIDRPFVAAGTLIQRFLQKTPCIATWRLRNKPLRSVSRHTVPALLGDFIGTLLGLFLNLVRNLFLLANRSQQLVFDLRGSNFSSLFIRSKNSFLFLGRPLLAAFLLIAIARTAVPAENPAINGIVSD